MAHVSHSKSAIKRQRQSLVRAERNQARRTEARTAVRTAREAIEDGDKEAAAAAVQAAGKVVDRTASKGGIHANNAARRKSRLANQLGSMDADSTDSK